MVFLGNANKGSGEPLDKAGIEEQDRGEEGVDDVEDESPDVCAVGILVGKDDEFLVVEGVHGGVRLADRESENVEESGDFFVLGDGVEGSVADVEGFAFESVDAKVGASDDGETGDGKGTCRVTFGEEETTVGLGLGDVGGGVVLVGDDESASGRGGGCGGDHGASGDGEFTGRNILEELVDDASESELFDEGGSGFPGLDVVGEA